MDHQTEETCDQKRQVVDGKKDVIVSAVSKQGVAANSTNEEEEEEEADPALTKRVDVYTAQVEAMVNMSHSTNYARAALFGIIIKHLLEEIRAISRTTQTNHHLREQLVRLRGVASRQQYPSPVYAFSTHDMVQLDFEIMEQHLLDCFDLNVFTKRVFELFQWHEQEALRTKYMAPYFAMVQSSGMGKTKLMWELRTWIEEGNWKKHENYKHKYRSISCKTVLCTKGQPREMIGDDEVFSHNLNVPTGRTLDDRDEIYSFLNNILTRQKDHDCVILLFAEADALLKNADAFAFQCVRWWLRVRRAQDVVAVFAGVTTELAYYHHDKSELYSPRKYALASHYECGKGKGLYPPFWELNTLGLFAQQRQPSNNDFERSLPYGRPLFALMQQQNQINEDTNFNVLRKLMINPYPDWSKDLPSCVSILGTRLQLSPTSDKLASVLVRKGYAVLSHYASWGGQEYGEEESRVCQIFFPSDPMCARFAMCLMDEDWFFDSSCWIACGKPKTFWMQTLAEILSTGLCHNTRRKGDSHSQLAAAAYLLFCGDVLRKEVDRDFKTFSVSLAKFAECLLHPKDCVDSSTTSSKRVKLHDDNDGGGGAETIICVSPPLHQDCPYMDAHVSFIQVVHVHLLLSNEIFYQQDVLQYHYLSATAIYPNHPTLDLVASIRLMKTTATNKVDELSYYYVPLFVSVSTGTYSNFGEEDVLKDIRACLNPTMGGLGLRLIFHKGDDGDDDKYKVSANDILCPQDVNQLLQGHAVSKVVVVAKDDPFGVTDMLKNAVERIPDLFLSYAKRLSQTDKGR